MTTDSNRTDVLPQRHPARIRTFKPRRGRLTSRHAAALERLWPAYGLRVPHADDIRSGFNRGTSLPPSADLDDPSAAEAVTTPLDLASLFPRRAPLVLEIGSGMGDATAEMAATDTARDYLAVEVHTPGIANLLDLVEQRGLTNVRVACGDALDLLRYGLPEESLDAILVFFPDPWPKSRHHKRRLIQPHHVALLRSRLVHGGTLHCATDWPEYAEAMLDTLTSDPELVNRHDGFAPRPPTRPQTRYERRALAAGRPVFDLIFHRR